MNNEHIARDRGMSLIELLVSVAILGVAMVGIIALLNLSTSYFSNSSREVEIQQELQTTFALVSNMLADANGTVVYTGSADHSTATAHIADTNNDYWIVKNEQKLYAVKNPADTSTSEITKDQNLLADHVDKFLLDLSHIDDGFVTLSMESSYGNRHASMSKNVYLRNSGKERAEFLSQCTVGSSISDNKKGISFDITQNTGADIGEGSIVIRIKLSVYTSGATEHQTITFADSGTTLSGDIIIESQSFNPVTGEVTLHCTIPESKSWKEGVDGKVTCTVALNKGTITDGYVSSICR